jgi:hypothetical protein
MKVAKTSGMLKIHGEDHGEIKDSSKLKEELICVLLLNATHIHLSKNHSL